MPRKEKVTEIIDLVGFRTASRKNVVYLHEVYQDSYSMSANSGFGIMKVDQFLNSLVGKLVEIDIVGSPKDGSKDVIAKVKFLGESVSNKILSLYRRPPVVRKSPNVFRKRNPV